MMSNAFPAPTGLVETRASVYRVLLLSLAKPSPEQHAWLRSTEFRRGLELLGSQFDVSIPDGELVPESFADFESRYIACFEVGLPEAPVVLLASHYSRNEPAPRVVHEHILFYRRFQVPPSDQTQEAADHLLNELAFLIHLDDLAQSGQVDHESLAWARRDFLDRHLARWAPRAAGLAEERGLPWLYRALLGLLAAVVQEDCALLDQTSDPPDSESRPR